MVTSIHKDEEEDYSGRSNEVMIHAGWQSAHVSCGVKIMYFTL
jgi:hypothetical protein